MSNRITAKEAFAKANVEYKNSLNEKVEEFLNEVYSKIDKAAEVGQFETTLEVPTYSDYHKEAAVRLEADGYGVMCNYSEYNNDYYMRIHWNGPFT